MVRQRSSDTQQPNVARVYDYFLGGAANYAVDREFGKRALQRFPFVESVAKANRLFLHRTVRYLLSQGVRQFIDIGSGVPTMGATHQIAAEAGGARVVYVDNEDVAVAQSKLELERDGDPRRHTVVRADLREPDELWQAVATSGIVTLREPVAVLLLAVLHVKQLDDAGRDVGPASVARLRELISPGSYFALSHGTDDQVPDGRATKMAEFAAMYDHTATPVIWRSQSEIEALFGDFELVEPGMTWTPLWRPEYGDSSEPDLGFSDPSESIGWAGVARKPRPQVF